METHEGGKGIGPKKKKTDISSQSLSLCCALFPSAFFARKISAIPKPLASHAHPPSSRPSRPPAVRIDARDCQATVCRDW
jgi:hypothetical protein